MRNEIGSIKKRIPKHSKYPVSCWRWSGLKVGGVRDWCVGKDRLVYKKGSDRKL